MLMKFDNNYKPKTSRYDYGWHARGNLPHLDANNHWQFVTFRLFDSMPQSLLAEWSELAKSDADFRKKIEKFLDSGYGECWLGIKEIAEMIVAALLFHNGAKYRLIAWVIMPNHVHVLFEQLEGEHLPDIMHSIKSFTAQKANKMLGRKGQFWMHESFDRYIRNSRHCAAVIKYIENNPVKAGLCDSPEEWRFSSAYRQD